MKSQSLSLPALAPLLAGALLALEIAHSAPSDKPAEDKTVGGGSIPQSVFVVPEDKTKGRDPFFPNSTRRDKSVVVAAPTNKSPVVELVCNGRSGTAEVPLVIINNTTFAVGDTNVVVTRSGRVLVHCLAIKQDSVEIEINGGEQKVLPFRSN